MPEHLLPTGFDEPGAETEEDSASLTETDLRQAFVTASDWTTETIVSQLRKGNVDLSPAFQRREVWDAKRKSTLIESIILNLPVPQIVLAERKDRPNTYLVLDGKQRLLSIRQFCVEDDVEADAKFRPLMLEKLAIRSDLNGHCYSTLEDDPGFADVVNAFDNHTIRTVVIRNWPNPDYLHKVFLRLNTGSVPLSPQELRQALIPGRFTTYIDEFVAKSEPLQKALGIDKPDFRMRDNEIFLRYLAFAFRAEEYSGNLKKFLDDTAEFLNTQWDTRADDVAKRSKSCEAAINSTIAIFGDRDSFSSYAGDAFEGRFNRAVFDVMTYYFSDDAVRERALKAKAKVKKAFIDLSQGDSEFVLSITTTTKSKKATAKRFVAWANSLSGAIGQKVTPPKALASALN